jgi:predicted phosphodiesterase
MEVVNLNIEYTRPETFKIYPIGDIHGGAVQCAEDEVKKQVALVGTERNSYIIGMGDWADAILKNDRRFDSHSLAPWVEKDNILESQRKWLRTVFEPVKNKIICILTGNHEETIHLFHQDDFIRNLCDDMGVRYGGYQCFLNLTFDRKNSSESHKYIFHLWHGAGAAQSDGAVTNRLMSLVNEMYARIYLMGHLHRIKAESPHRLECKNGKIQNVELIAACTGSWLKGYTQSTNSQRITPSYVEMKGYKPARIGCPIISITPDTNEISVTIP